MVETQVITLLVKDLSTAYNELLSRKAERQDKYNSLRKQANLELDAIELLQSHIDAVKKAYKALTGADMKTEEDDT